MSELPHGPVTVIGPAYNMLSRMGSMPMGQDPDDDVGGDEDYEADSKESQRVLDDCRHKQY